MVSLNTILAIGGIGAAYILFQSLGGASGIGSRIGGGFATFGTSLTSALNPLSNLSNPFRTGFTEDGQFYDTSALTGSSTTPQQRQDSLDKQNDPNLSHDRWEDVITEVCDKYGNCKSYDGSGIINETPKSERDTSFDFFPSAYGDTYNDNRTNQSSFASRGLVTQGYQEPNYSISGAGYTATNFFGGNPDTYVNPWSAKFG